MEKDRLAAFSDGVIAIIVTIMVLELKAPHDSSWSALLALAPTFASYVLSFLYVAIYWNNHHHMLHVVRRIDGRVLWANTHLLFWLSLVPFTTAWMSENHFANVPVALYGVTLLMPAIAYFLLSKTLIWAEGDSSTLARALGADIKGKLSLGVYVVGVAAALADYPLAALALYWVVALIWFVPDRRIEKTLG